MSAFVFARHLSHPRRRPDATAPEVTQASHIRHLHVTFPNDSRDMSSGSQSPEHTRRVAIIEDEADIAGLLAHCFACEGFQVMTARDGDVGWDVIRRHRPDLIVLDLMLPNMSGWEVFRSMKANRSLQNIPVVVLSANSDVANRISLLEEGVDDYIVKPCSVREVIARARAVLRRGERSNPGMEGAHDTQGHNLDCR